MFAKRKKDMAMSKANKTRKLNLNFLGLSQWNSQSEEFLRVDSLNFRKRTVRDFQLDSVKFRTLRPKLYCVSISKTDDTLLPWPCSLIPRIFQLSLQPIHIQISTRGPCTALSHIIRASRIGFEIHACLFV